MFGELGQMAGLLTQLPKLKAEMEKMKQRLEQVVAEGTAGGGMVTARVNGSLELLGCTLSDEALSLGDKEMLEDLIRAAVNQSMEKAKLLAAEETRKMASSFGVPGGLAGLFGK
jgi:nucleoid-associated protein EbfC